MILLPFLLVTLSGILVVNSSTSVYSSSSTNANMSSSPTTLAANSSVLPPPEPKGIMNVGVTSNQLAAGGPPPWQSYNGA